MLEMQVHFETDLIYVTLFVEALWKLGPESDAEPISKVLTTLTLNKIKNVVSTNNQPTETQTAVIK